MRNFKKIVAVLVTLSMFLSVVAFSANAEDAPTIKLVGRTQMEREDLYDVDLVVTGEDVGGVQGTITYNTSVFKYEGVEFSEEFDAANKITENNNVVKVDETAGTIAFIGINPGNGATWFTLKFKALTVSDAKFTIGEGALNLMVSKTNGIDAFTNTVVEVPKEVKIIERDQMNMLGATIRAEASVGNQDIKFMADIDCDETKRIVEYGMIFIPAQLLPKGEELVADPEHDYNPDPNKTVKAAIAKTTVDHGNEVSLSATLRGSASYRSEALLEVDIYSRAYIKLDDGTVIYYSNNDSDKPRIVDGYARKSIIGVAKSMAIDLINHDMQYKVTYSDAIKDKADLITIINATSLDGDQKAAILELVNINKDVLKKIEADAKHEESNTGDATVLYNKQTSKYDNKADEMRQAIINSKDSDLSRDGAQTYYVSYRGDDSNDGTSPASAWRSIDKVNSSVPTNSVVLFERDGVYRGNLELKSDCSYGAYGKGSKPAIYGSKMNYADESLWTESTTHMGAWEASIDETDAGQIVFDHGKQVATKKVSDATAEPYNFELSDGKVYLYISDNPAKLYDSIEIGGNQHVIRGVNVDNVVIENLCVKYGGKHGISFDGNIGCENITIRNCEVGYVGGAGGSDTIPPVGNGIELWLNTNTAIVENCWVYECFDAGITNQGQNATHTQENITFKNNLIEYCIYGIEYFAKGSEGSVIKDTLYTGNLIRFSGLGWSDPTTRFKEDWEKSGVSAINGWGSKPNVGGFEATEFVIENNILDTSWKYMINLFEPNQTGRVTVKNNTYYQKITDTAAIWYNDGPVRAENDAQFKSEIAKIDSSPKLAELE